MFSSSHARDKTGAIWQTTGQVEHAERQHPREAARVKMVFAVKMHFHREKYFEETANVGNEVRQNCEFFCLSP